MKRIFTILAVGATAAAVTAVGGAQTPTETPFPSPTVVQYFVSTQTVAAPGVLANFFPQGATVTFRAFAGQSKTGKVLTGDAARFFYITIPNQPNVKLTYSADSKKWPWSGTWTIPADYPSGVVPLKVLLQTKDRQRGSFVQIPVATSQLTVTKKA